MYRRLSTSMNRIRCYNTLRNIAKDNMAPTFVQRKVYVYWGLTRTGKSHRAWKEGAEHGPTFGKDPCTKFWDGYRPDEHTSIVIDEFSGVIGISHLLRWTDKYPVNVEQKHTGVPFLAKWIYLTSNVDPREWYPTATEEQRKALLRRCEITYFGELNQLEAARFE